MQKFKNLDELHKRIAELDREEVQIKGELTEHVRELTSRLSLRHMIEHTVAELREDPALPKKIATAGILLLVNYLHKRVSQPEKKHGILSTLAGSISPAGITSMIRNVSGEIYRWISRPKRKHEDGNGLPVNEPIGAS